ncbi:MAG: GNAT family N-acetyltransferase [Bacteroidales bacterium]|nr:GNAT family N-acetyltransferase [Bacteroidales bacterium]
MIIQSKNNRQVLLQRLTADDIDKLTGYFQKLGTETLKRYGPHGFDKQSLSELYKNAGNHAAFIAEDTETSEIIAYSVILSGYLEHDSFRLQSYGLTLNHVTDCTFAPSVADEWQSQGIGNSLFHFMLADLKLNGIKRIILWGGVQSDNQKAVNYYLKNGFRILGEFEYYGLNYDMILEIN